MATKKYGVVYTPDRLADFVAELLHQEAASDNYKVLQILDPACGECALLKAADRAFGESTEYVGIDVDKDAISANNDAFEVLYNDAILPRNVKKKTAEYWKSKLPCTTAIIANPPWSSEKIYDKDELAAAGFGLIKGQYDSYVLFIELAYSIVAAGGYFAFIIPDSLFDAQNESLRRFLTDNTEIRVIARLGEKIFDEVNRATTVIICKKEKPNSHTKTKCFRLSTDERKEFLASNKSLMSFYDKKKHEVLQGRFLSNVACNFDVDTRSDEEELLLKISRNSIDWDNIFIFGRGVEISKSGKIVYCPSCHYAQGYKKSQLESGSKICTNCGKNVPVTETTVQNVVQKLKTPGSVQVYVGENVRRYALDGEYFIQPDIEGINYKNRILYTPPKLLVRKTGLGIYAALDYSGSMTTQTVYILKKKDENSCVPLEYYLALINSRVVYYFYLKVYGENEWKSHPYFTKQIIYSLPVKNYEDSELDKQIISCARTLAKDYNHDVDVALEYLIMEKYELTEQERRMIIAEMNSLPDLGAINDMKIEEKNNVQIYRKQDKVNTIYNGKGATTYWG